MQKDQGVPLDEAKETLKQAGVPEDHMASLEKKVVGFVSAGVESQSDGGIKTNANNEDIDLPEGSDSEDDEKIEIAQKNVPSEVFGGLVRKREEDSEKKEGTQLGALERIKRLKAGN